MYNPYLKEDFQPIQEDSEIFTPETLGNTQNIVPSDEISAVMNALSNTPFDLSQMEGKLATLKNMAKVKDFLKLDQLSFLGDLFSGKKEGKPRENRGKPDRNHENLGGQGGNISLWEEETEEGFFEKLKKKLHLENVDTGDILLVIIVIYLMLEGDDTLELAITLGILAFFWWSDSKKEEND